MFNRGNRVRVAAGVAVVALACGSIVSPVAADGDETLGPPSLAIAAGTDIRVGGVGLVDSQPGVLSVNIPAGASVEQVILYWEGLHSDDTVGFDDDIVVDGNTIDGVLIGGPSFFFGGPANRHWSSTYRADITSLGLVAPGINNLSVGGLTFDRKNDGAGILVIIDDGSGAAGIDIVDGNDTVFINFPSPRDATVPQTLTFPPAAFDRVGEVDIFASSVEGQDLPGDRPNIILVTVDGVVNQYDNVLGSNDGGEWDTIEVAVNIPAGVGELTIELVSDDPADPDTGNLPASMVFNAAAVKVPPVALAGLGDFVWFDADGDGIQDPGETGVEGALVELLQGGIVIDSQVTPFGGGYVFAGLQPGDYQVRFTPPAGSQLTLQDQGIDDEKDSDADPTTGLSPIVNLSPGELDLTIDAGIVPGEPGIDIEKLTNGNQADGANDADVPQIAPGDPVTWSYVVTNTGDVAFDLADVVVSDDVVGVITNIVDDGDGDGVLSPGEVWIYEAPVPDVALDLDTQVLEPFIVDGCNPDGTPVPGDRATYENIGTVTVPGDDDSDPSHYCNPPDPGIDIEKLTNGNQADGANDADVPQIAPGDPVTWTYIVTNTGDVAFDLADVVVSDDIVGAITNIVDDGDGDGVLAPGEVWTYEATAAPDGAQDLTNPDVGTIIVQGCNPGGGQVPGDRATYENIGTVTVPGDSDADPSHYCNPPGPGIDIEKLTNGNDADLSNDADVPQVAPGDPVTWSYVVTNTGDVAFDIAEIDVSDDIVGAITGIAVQGDGDDTLAPGEVWIYVATAPGGAQDLENPDPGTVIVPGCNPNGTPVPGDRATYENIGTVTVPGDDDSDPSHYCNPPEPGIDIEKLTNGNDADGANDADVPQIAPGDPVTWTYIVSNTGDVGYDIGDVVVSDDVVGPITNIVDQGDGDGVLAPGEVWTYEASAPAGALDLEAQGLEPFIVDGCNPGGTSVPGDRATYENIGTVTVPGDGDSDPSHYCNPPDPGIDIEKLTNGNQADGANDADVPQVAAGDPVTWSYVVTNTGDVAFDLADVVVSDDVVGPITNIVDDGDGDGVLSPGEVWTYEAPATGGAQDLANPDPGTVIVQGCNPGGGQVPGDRATYENIGSVTVPGDDDSDPSHYCNPPGPGIDIEKLTNGNQADGANDADVPQVAAGDPVTWTYIVTNTGDVAFDLADVDVSDDIVGAVTNIVDQGDGDDTLAPGEVWTYEATAPGGAQDLANPDPGTVIVDGCNPGGGQVPGDRATYENIGSVTVPGDDDSDPSHYCNPPDPGIDVEKLTNGNDADGANDADVPQVAAGDPVTWTYIVTNTGDVAFDLADVDVSDDVVGAVTNIVDQGDGDGVLAPGEVWTYEASAPAGALDLDAQGLEPFIVDGCNPGGDAVPGDRATYENIGTVTVPGDDDSDPSHYCNPPDPGIDIEKLTNGNQADGANDIDVPEIVPGDSLTWLYIVTNTGDVAFDIADVVVTDDTVGAITNIIMQGDGDDVLVPGEVWIYEFVAAAGAQDLENPQPGTTIVPGCKPGPGPTPNSVRATYENIGIVVVPGDDDSDPSHYCNPEQAEIDIEKFTKVIPTTLGGDVCESDNDVFDKPVRVTMRYNGGNAADTSTSQQDGKFEVTGNANGADPVFIIGSSDDNGGGDVYFSGIVNLGETFVIDAATAGKDKLNSATHVTVYTAAGGSVLQNVEFHTSCSAPLVLGDQFGSLVLTALEDDQGNVLTLPDPDPTDIGQDADVPTGPQANIGDDIQWTYLVTNPGDVELSDVVVTDDNGTAGDTADDFTATPVEEGGLNVGDDDGDGLLDPGETWVFRATGVAVLGQYANLGSVIGTPVNGSPDVTDEDPSHYFALFDQDLCEAFEKPGLITMLYTGDGPEATSTGQDPGKVEVTGDPNDASPVRIIVSKNPGGDGDVFFDGVVSLGGTFVIDANTQSLGGETHITILSLGGAVLQQAEFHTSCSQPLFIGDQYGASRIVDFVDEDGQGPGTGPAPVIFVDKLEFKDQEVKFKIKNEGNTTVTITELELVWPQATNQNLKEVKSDGKTVFKPQPTVGSPYTVSGSDWRNVDKLVLEDGKDRELKLLFVKKDKISKDPADYSIIVRFDDGTELVVDP